MYIKKQQLLFVLKYQPVFGSFYIQQKIRKQTQQTTDGI
jgi:hypothetical protein